MCQGINCHKYTMSHITLSSRFNKLENELLQIHIKQDRIIALLNQLTQSLDNPVSIVDEHLNTMSRGDSHPVWSHVDKRYL